MRASIDLAYVGLGVHEQLVAYAADQLDYFADEGVHVAVRDGRRWPIERLRRGAVVGLGRTQVSRLRDGVPWTILCVNTDRPMFWLVARRGHDRIGDLRGRRIAMHDAASAPGLWTRIVLRRHGLDPDRDLTAIAVPAGDYRAHVRMLRAGDVDAAVIGSSLFPPEVEQETDGRVLTFFGDEIRIPTTGVAVDRTTVDPDGAAVRGVVAAHRRALHTLTTDAEVAVGLLRGVIPGLTSDDATVYYEGFVRPHFLADGVPRRATVESGLAALSGELGGVSVPPLDDLYRTGMRDD